MRQARFVAAAEAELQAEAVFYERHTSGLGKCFVREVEASLDIACEFPSIGAPYKHGTRRVFPKKFPFSIVYRLDGDAIVVLAIAPFSKKPGYWRDRTSAR